MDLNVRSFPHPDDPCKLAFIAVLAQLLPCGIGLPMPRTEIAKDIRSANRDTVIVIDFPSEDSVPAPVAERERPGDK